MKETERSINKWQGQTFGGTRDPAVFVGRALEEFAELVELLDFGWGAVGEALRSRTVNAMKSSATLIKESATLEPENVSHAIGEAADIRIVLTCLCGGRFDEAVDLKMKVNRRRKWRRDGEGAWRHVDP